MSNPHDSESLPTEPGLSTASLAGVGTSANETTEETRTFAAPDTTAARTTDEDRTTPLLSTQETGELRGKWDTIQAGFVDEPRKAVEDADGLVAAAMKRLAETFATERASLEGQWDRGDDVSTEDLRLALRRYRAFFERLLAI
jgi:hypothetical protein